MTQHFCKCCNGIRPNNGSICLGCGTLLKVCARPEPKAPARRNCPCCGRTTNQREIEAGRFLCDGCRTVFEPEEVHYFDDRPDVSLEKKERYEAAKDKRRRKL